MMKTKQWEIFSSTVDLILPTRLGKYEEQGKLRDV